MYFSTAFVNCIQSKKKTAPLGCHPVGSSFCGGLEAGQYSRHSGHVDANDTGAGEAKAEIGIEARTAPHRWLLMLVADGLCTRRMGAV
jgi:hypothetical protein